MYGDDYIKALQLAKVCLGLLSKGIGICIPLGLLRFPIVGGCYVLNALLSI